MSHHQHDKPENDPRDRQHAGEPQDKRHDEIGRRAYPEDERLREIEEYPDRRMTREEWEREESNARQAANKKREQVKHDREMQQEHDKKKKTQHRNWGRIFLWVGVGAVVLLLIFVLGYLPHRTEQKKAEAEAKQHEHEEPEVQVTQVRRSKTPGELTVPGTTSALTEAYLYARANGYLKKRYVDIGDHVREGQLLALIDAPDLDQQVDQAREQLRQAEAQQSQQQATLAFNQVTYERWRTLVAKGVFSRQDGDQREADFLAQRAVLVSAERNVESYRANLARVLALQRYERITAPFSGVVTQRNTDVGALVGSSGAASTAPGPQSMTSTGGSANIGMVNTSGTSGNANQSATPTTGQAQGGPIFAVAQFDTLRILISVPEGYAESITRGMSAQVFIQERPGKKIMGTVARTANSLDQNTRTMLVEVDVPNRDGSLYPGMYAVVSFVQARGVAPLTVPGDAVVVRQDKNTVAVVKDDKIAMVPVEIGRDYGPSVEILNGLKEGDWIVTSVTDDVQQGVKVRPQKSREQGEDAGSGGAQQDKAPDSGPNQYGDQSIVNASSESTNQKGKPGQQQEQQQQKPGGEQQKKASKQTEKGSQ